MLKLLNGTEKGVLRVISEIQKMWKIVDECVEKQDRKTDDLSKDINGNEVEETKEEDTQDSDQHLDKKPFEEGMDFSFNECFKCE